jgi:hypothetical protein
MNNTPSIGQARGVFEILIPGAFVWLNLMLVLYLSADQSTRKASSELVSSTGETLAIMVAFGYLIGVTLRLFRSELPDLCSARVLRWSRRARLKDGKYKTWAIEDFPYPKWLRQVCEDSYPAAALEFYDNVWLGTGSGKGDKEFFNLCKSVVGSLDKDAAAEMYSAEALCRYISGMFYALLVALVVILVALIFIHTARLVLAILLGMYGVAFGAILKNYRFLRIKEVKTVFSLAFCNRDSLEKLFSLTHRAPAP